MSNIGDAAPRKLYKTRESHRAPDLLSVLSAGIPDWMLEAACKDADPDIFFPERGGQPGPAKAICAGCPVTEECLEYALAGPYDRHELAGIWGGKSGLELRKLKQKQRQEARR